MLEISFFNKTDYDSKLFEKIATQLIKNGIKILNYHKEDLTLAVQFVTDEEALKLNIKYRNKAYIPDVLSFPTNFSENEIRTVGFRELGDIVISLAEAKRKANKYHHSFETELAFLIVHGFLHLCGFDHEKNLVAEAEMFAWQDEILASANYKYEIKNS